MLLLKSEEKSMMTMKETITKVGIFTVGAFIGAAITYKRLKTKYRSLKPQRDLIRNRFFAAIRIIRPFSQ